MIRESVPVRTACVLRSLSQCVELMGRLMGIAAKLAVPGWRWCARENVHAVNKDLLHICRMYIVQKPIREIKVKQWK